VAVRPPTAGAEAIVSRFFSDRSMSGKPAGIRQSVGDRNEERKSVDETERGPVTLFGGRVGAAPRVLHRGEDDPEPKVRLDPLSG
jgi:hypothetical protein